MAIGISSTFLMPGVFLIFFIAAESSARGSAQMNMSGNLSGSFQPSSMVLPCSCMHDEDGQADHQRRHVPAAPDAR